MEAHESADIMCVEVQIDSVASPEREEKSSLLNSAKKRSKRKYQDNELRDKTPKKPRNVDSNKNISHCDSSDDGSKHTKKVKERTRTRKNNVDIDPAELKNVLDGMDDEINDVLEETAEKNKLTAANVKNILRHVITNEYVLAMVRNTMKAENDDGDLEEAVFEPKLTRSKVKELREKQHILPWPMSTPVKQPESATKALLEEEFPDESSSDEDYKPNEEECPSEEDNLVGSPKSADLDSSLCGKPASAVPNTTEENADADDEIGLVIALPEPEPEPIPHEDENMEVDKIALRTRSKLPLKDTPLEVIEASFVAPDISEDMYDTHCDDEEWQKFLQEFRALDTIVAVEKLDEEPDNAEDDPEYNVLDDDDIPDELDLRYDNNVKVTRKELNALIAEMLETAQVELNDGDIDEDEEDTEPIPRIETPIMDVADDFVENVRTQWMTNEERLRLEEQMRMYVQILTQSYLLSFGIPELNFINVSCKLFLDEIKMFASLPNAVNEHSAFSAHNLDGALEIVNYYENNKEKIHIRTNLNNGSKKPGIPSLQVKKTLYNNPVFMYPDLLPIGGFYKAVETKKPVFTSAEDNLIAIGLEEFSFSTYPVYYIQTLLIPPKTEYQIKLRIKNSKASKRAPNNPIKYFYQHGKAPPFPRTIRPFNPSDVKAPKDYPAEMLPNWMGFLCTPAILSTSSAPIRPKPSKPSIKKRTFNNKTFIKPMQRMLLPRGNHFSPLKHISPILKKYNQKRRARSGISPLAPRVRNTAGVYKRPAIKPLISPKSVDINEKIIQESVTETTNVHSAVISNNLEAETGHSDSVLINCKNTVQGTNGNGAAYLVNAETASASECTPDLNANECDIPVESEAVDDGDEEIIDDEHESTHQDLIMTNNMINKKQSANKKKNKQQRDLESSLALLQPNLVENDPKREERETLFANSYLLRVTEALKEDPDTQEKFLKTLCKYQHSAKSPVKIYLEIKDILKDYPALAEDFIAFLRPEQAKDCGKYKEFLTLGKIRAFIRKIEVHFSNQPQHLLKILRTLAQFKQQASISSVEVLSMLQPLLKNQSHLIEELTNLLPDMAPPESLMTDFQEVTIPNSDDDNSSVDSCEEIQIPESTDPYGGKDCPCDCHTSSTEVKVVNKTRHCVKCGVKFMDGKIFIQTGKVLKPAQVVYREVPPEPSKVSSDTKTIAKNKTNCSPSGKTSVVTEQGSKSEIPQTKKDPIKTPCVIQQPHILPEEPVPSTSKLPCDVFEDTVFPAGVHANQSKKSVPSDFSQLKEVMGQTNDKDATSNGRPSDNSTEAAKSSEQVSQSQTSVAQQKDKWTRDEDKLIIYNCQRFGITEKAFQSSSSTFKSRTSEEVQGRFMHLMNLLSKELKI